MMSQKRNKIDHTATTNKTLASKGNFTSKKKIYSDSEDFDLNEKIIKASCYIDCLATGLYNLAGGNYVKPEMATDGIKNIFNKSKGREKTKNLIEPIAPKESNNNLFKGFFLGNYTADAKKTKKRKIIFSDDLDISNNQTVIKNNPQSQNLFIRTNFYNNRLIHPSKQKEENISLKNNDIINDSLKMTNLKSLISGKKLKLRMPKINTHEEIHRNNYNNIDNNNCESHFFSQTKNVTDQISHEDNKKTKKFINFNNKSLLENKKENKNLDEITNRTDYKNFYLNYINNAKEAHKDKKNSSTKFISFRKNIFNNFCNKNDEASTLAEDTRENKIFLNDVKNSNIFKTPLKCSTKDMFNLNKDYSNNVSHHASNIILNFENHQNNQDMNKNMKENYTEKKNSRFMSLEKTNYKTYYDKEAFSSSINNDVCKAINNYNNNLNFSSYNNISNINSIINNQPRNSQSLEIVNSRNSSSGDNFFNEDINEKVNTNSNKNIIDLNSTGFKFNKFHINPKINLNYSISEHDNILFDLDNNHNNHINNNINTNIHKYKNFNNINVKNNSKNKNSLNINNSSIITKNLCLELNSNNTNANNFSLSITNGNISMAKKKEIESKIIKECLKTSHGALGLKEKIEKVKPMDRGIFRLRKDIGKKHLMTSLEKDIVKENQRFKKIKRFIIYPKDLMNPVYICDSEKNVIREAQYVDNLNEVDAFEARNLIYNKYKVYVGEGNVYGYIPDVKKDFDRGEFIENYIKQQRENNSFKVNKLLINILRKQNAIKENYGKKKSKASNNSGEKNIVSPSSKDNDIKTSKNITINK